MSQRTMKIIVWTSVVALVLGTGAGFLSAFW